MKPILSLSLVVVRQSFNLGFFSENTSEMEQEYCYFTLAKSLCFPCSTFLLENFLAVILIIFFTVLLKPGKHYMEKLRGRRGLVNRDPKCLAVITIALSWGTAEAMCGAGCKAESFPAGCFLNWLFIFKLFWSSQQILLYTAVEVKY